MPLARRRRSFPIAILVSAVTAATALAFVPTAQAGTETVSSYLPGGTSVTIDASLPAGSASNFTPRDVTLAGKARITGKAPAPERVVYAINTGTGALDSSTACGVGDVNGDGFKDTLLDCEIDAALALNRKIADQAPDKRPMVAIVKYGHVAGSKKTATTVLSLSEVNASTVGAINSALVNLKSEGPFSNIYAASAAACDATKAKNTSIPSTIVLMVTGQEGSTGTGCVLNSFKSVTFQVLTVGDRLRCDAPPQLRALATNTGGTCIDVPTDKLAQLRGRAARTIDQLQSSLVKIEGTIDGGSREPLTMVPVKNRPLEATYSWTVGADRLPEGPHTLCAIATAEDDEGSAEAQACQSFTVRFPTLSSTSGSAVPEGDDPASCTPAPVKLRLEDPAPSSIDIDYSTSDRSATAGTDYRQQSGTVTFARGDLEKTVTFCVLGDVQTENSETFRVTFDGGVRAGTAVADVTITDDDRFPRVSVVSGSVKEGNSGTDDLVMKVTRSLASAEEMSVDWSTGPTSPVEATAGVDYVPSSGTVVWKKGDKSLEKLITIPVNGDLIDEPDEQFLVSLANLKGGGAALAARTGIGTIVDDDDPAVQLEVGDASVVEGDSGTSTMTFTVTRSRVTGSALSVDWSTGDAPVDPKATGGVDYVTGAGTVTWPANDQSLSKTFIVQVRPDLVNEPNEKFAVLLSNPAASVVVALKRAQGLGTIIDDDQPVSVSVGDARAVEGDDGTVDMIFTVTRSRASGERIVFDWSTEDQSPVSATAGLDYLSGSGTLEWPANDNALTRTFVVKVRGDLADEPNETFTARIANLRGGTAVIGTAAGVGTVVDDDEPVDLCVDSVSVTEGDAGTATMTFTVTRSRFSGEQIDVRWATFDKTPGAIAGTDYEPGSGALKWAADDRSLTRTFSVKVKGDRVDEPDERFGVRLSDATGGTVTLRCAEGAGTIVDDDEPVTVGIDDVQIKEGDDGNRNLVFTVTRSRASGERITFDWATQDGVKPAATAGVDYEAGSGTLGWEPTDDALTTTISVVINSDLIDEPDETLRVALSRLQGGTASFRKDVGVGTIVDDDEPVVLTIDDVSVQEGNTGIRDMTFTVRRDRFSGEAITFDWATGDGPADRPRATPGVDYEPASGTAGWAADDRALTRKLTVKVRGDIVDEPDEALTVALSNVVGGTARAIRPVGVGTILDDDRNGTFSCQSAGLRLGGFGIVEANSPYRPCRDQARSLLTLSDLPQVGAGAVTASTDSTPDDPALVPPAVTDRAVSSSRTTDLKVDLPGLKITAEALSSTATASCDQGLGTTPRLDGSSTIVGLRINGQPIDVTPGQQRIEIPGVAAVWINSRFTTGTDVTQRALWVQGLGALSAVDLVVADARAGFTGNPCTS